MQKIGRIVVLTLLILGFSVTSVLAAGSEYIVKSGDSLWKIAQNNSMSVSELKTLNGLTSDFLSIGDKLMLRSSPNRTPVVSVSRAPIPTASAGNGVYVVQAGDSLWQISLRSGTSVARLKELNGLTSDMLSVGQKLNIGTGAVAVAVPSRSGDSIDGSRVITKAAEFLGTKYSYGGQSPSGFDCSGFVYYIYKQFGYSLPRTAADQFEKGLAVEKDSLQAGDLVFFTWGGGSYINHVGIYSGNGQFIHSSSPSSGGVIYSSLTNGSYANYYAGAKRILR